MKVISDSSPLITLGKIGHLNLLPDLYERIVITPQVYSEVVVGGAGLAASSQVSAASWIDVAVLRDPERPVEVQQSIALGLGELSVIQLGQEYEADLILIDDLKARIFARQMGLKVLGCIGVMLDAFRSNMLGDLTETFRQLRSSGAYVDPRLLGDILKRLNLPPL